MDSIFIPAFSGRDIKVTCDKIFYKKSNFISTVKLPVAIVAMRALSTELVDFETSVRFWLRVIHCCLRALGV